MSCAVCGRNDYDDAEECPYTDGALETLESGKKIFEKNWSDNNG